MGFKKILRLAAACVCLLALSPPARAALSFVDGGGAEVTLARPPERVISLVPDVTEMILGLGARGVLKGVTLPSAAAARGEDLKIVGGFFSPSLRRICQLKPDLVFLADRHSPLRSALAQEGVKSVTLKASTLSDVCANINLVGAILGRFEAAAKVVADIEGRVGLIAAKLARIPPAKRRRVMRFIGRDEVMTPGDDSFQNAFIEAAGGLPPRLGKKGRVVPVSLVEWRAFNPQVVYGGDGDREAAARLLQRPGWREVEAVREGRVIFFPEELASRASVRSGFFITWLAAAVYADEFARPDNLVTPERSIAARAMDLDLSYVKSAQVIDSRIYDFLNQSLVIDFEEPTAILSTLEGHRQGVESVGNHYFPPPCWGLLHHLSLAESSARVCRVLGRDPATASFLFTGARMDNLALGWAAHQDLAAWALVTAGVRSNALRAGADEGRFLEPGTINIIILTNRRLSPRAMTRAIITATEAKTAALQDLDVRSAESPLSRQATGTGTDNLIVVQGAGPEATLSGGHAKMGELIARAVHEGVKEAVRKQNGLVSRRSVFERLRERGLNPLSLARRACGRGPEAGALSAALEELLLEPRHAAWVASALALEDAWRRGLIGDLSAWTAECERVAETLAGGAFVRHRQALPGRAGPLDLALEALLEGLRAGGSLRAESEAD